MKRYISILFMIVGFKSYSQVNPTRIQVPSYQFQNFIYDARSAGLGEGGIALSPDGNSAYLNPAKLSFLWNRADSTNKSLGLAVNYSPYARNLIDDMNLLGANVYKVKNEREAFGVSVKYFMAGSVNLTDEIGTSIGVVTSSELSLMGTYSRKLSTKSSLAIGLKYIYSNLTSKQSLLGQSLSPANSFAADVYYFHTGKLYENQVHWLNYGVSITNLGGKVSYGDVSNLNFQPTTLRLGIAEYLHVGRKNRLGLSFDANRLLIPTPPVRDGKGNIVKGKDPTKVTALETLLENWSSAPDGFSETLREINYNLGIELTFQELLSLRGGYQYQDKAKGNMKFFTVGLGAKVKGMNLDLSYLIPQESGNPLAHTLRFSLGMKL